MTEEKAKEIIMYGVYEKGDPRYWQLSHLMGELFSNNPSLEQFMNALEKEAGEYAANSWLANVLYSTGLYKKDAGGNVIVTNP